MHESPDLAAARALVGLALQQGKYKLLRVLGVGGMGAVFEAINTWTTRRVAIKLLADSLTQDADCIARLQQEAQASTRIAHPNIIEVLDVCREPDGRFFIVSELLDGQSLEGFLWKRGGTLSPVEAVEVILPVAGALASAHACGVIHRDIKPDNIFLHRDRGGAVIPKVIDFGISKVVDGSGGNRARTRTGVVMGTVDYMSPEQARGESSVDAQTDVWALGVVLFRLLSGKLPFDADNVNMSLIKIATEPAPPLRALAPTVDPALAAVIDRALVSDRRRRFRSMNELIESLLAWLDGLGQRAAFERRFADSFPRMVAPQLGANAPDSDPMHAAPTAVMASASHRDTAIDPPPVESTTARRRARRAGVIAVGSLLAFGFVLGAALRAINGGARDPGVHAATGARTTQTIEPASERDSAAAPVILHPVALPSEPSVTEPAATGSVTARVQRAARATDSGAARTSTSSERPRNGSLPQHRAYE
jgi:serine/threonine-protein kinase